MTVKQEAAVKSKHGANYSVVHAGSLDQLDTFKLEVPDKRRTIRGKLFLRDLLGLSGMQISMNKLLAGASVPFLHQHKQNEEVYIFVKGRGEMQVDDDIFAVEEGTIVRVATGGQRCWRNNSTEDLYVIVVQAKENSLEGDTFEDGLPVNRAVVWPD